MEDARRELLPRDWRYFVQIHEWHYRGALCILCSRRLAPRNSVRHLSFPLFTRCSNHTHCLLFCLIRNLVQKQIRTLAQSAREKINTLYFIEEIPFTQNEEYFFNYRNKLLARYRTLLRESRGQFGLVQSLEGYQPTHNGYPDAFWNDINTILSKLVARGIHGVQASDLAKLLPSDSMDPALEIMAEVRAYFQGTSARNCFRLSAHYPGSLSCFQKIYGCYTPTDRHWFHSCIWFISRHCTLLDGSQ